MVAVLIGDLYLHNYSSESLRRVFIAPSWFSEERAALHMNYTGDGNVKDQISAPLNASTSMGTTTAATPTNLVVLLPADSHHNHPPNHELLLTTPFYIYEELIMLNATIGDQTLLELYNLPDRNPKHDDDFKFLQAAMRHPMRTTDPHKARLFVVPFLASFICYRVIYQRKDHGPQVCFRGMCGRDIIVYIDSFLGKSPFFMGDGSEASRGRNHILTFSYFRFYDRSIGFKRL